MPDVLVEASAELPDLLGLVRAHLRDVSLTQADLVLGYLQGAVDEFESTTGRPVLSSTWDCFWDRFPAKPVIKLPGKTTEVVSLSYVPASTGVAVTWPAANYVVDLASDPGRLALAVGASWPSDPLVSINGVVVRRIAGWTLATLPADIRTALLFRVQFMFDGGSDNPTATELYLKRLDEIWTATVRRYHSY